MIQVLSKFERQQISNAGLTTYRMYINVTLTYSVNQLWIISILFYRTFSLKKKRYVNKYVESYTSLLILQAMGKAGMLSHFFLLPREQICRDSNQGVHYFDIGDWVSPASINAIWMKWHWPQSLCNRSFWWRFCVVHWFSNFLLV